MKEVFEPVIGIEVHTQLKTESKLFCSCSTRFDAAPNRNTCPVCLGLPGALPVLNKKALLFGIKTGLAFNCEIAEFSGFDRKNYFYPDLSKNYQITQDAFPIGTNGHIDVMTDGKTRRIRIKRVHLEEDAGKSVHEGGTITGAAYSLEDYNRAGVPLLEIVSEPDIRSPKEAYEYLLMLRCILLYLEVSDCKMEEGSLRCDVNISIRPEGSDEFGTQVELKNLNSFRAVERSLEYEVERQSQLVASGGEVIRETRHWDEASQVTVSMRRKERAEDYRYFPEPDLAQLNIRRSWVDEIKATLPELPAARRMRFIESYGLPEYDASLLTDTKELADYFEAVVREYGEAKTVSNWIMGELSRLMNATGIGIESVKVRPGDIAAMLKMIDKGTISGKIAKTVFEEMFAEGKSPETIVKEKGLVQITDEEELAKIVDCVIEENREVADQVREGKDKALGFLVGQVMKMTKGRANPQAVNKLLRQRLAN
ncbi:MAG: Asp-tRNA(Asn)/Glu-tRNA(Gln) amidotransferase subunit GatB [Firmicutes bacterium]|nr:Asp-tRNA(Asn)/Glu-tRNA(Gln) amidotransferase subunit GatB [Bacillota bacterium]